MRVIYSLTPNLYPVLLPSIMSLLDHNEVEKIYILAMDERLPYELPEVCEVIKVDPMDYIKPDSPNIKCVWTPMCLVRLATAKIIPDDKVLQLDVDTIINDSLEPLWNIDLTGNYFAMAKETKADYRPFGENYYNCGVCLINLKKLREDHADDKLLEYINTKKTMCVDQDAINSLGHIVEFPSRYNECFATGYSENPAIVHYAAISEWWIPISTPRWSYYGKYEKYER